MEEILLRAENISKAYFYPTETVQALGGLDFSVAKGDFVLIFGPSGSGKTTLLNVLGGLDKPDDGQLVFDGERYDNRSDRWRTHLRRHKLGVIFQSFELVSAMSCYDNIEYPLLLQGVESPERKKRILEAAETLGIEELLKRKPERISGGQRQRVAIARALVGRYQCILGDEITGNLDVVTSERVYLKLRELNKQWGHTFVMVSHDHNLAQYADRVYTLQAGKLVGEKG